MTETNSLMTQDEAMTYLAATGKVAVNVVDDFIPTLVTQDFGGIVTIHALMVDDLHAGVAALLANLSTNEHGQYFVSLTVDSYMAKFSPERTAELVAAGEPVDLSKLFAAGDPDVGETLRIYAAFLDGDRATVRGLALPYVRTDDEILWLDEYPIDKVRDVRVGKALALAIELSNGLEPSS